MRDIQLAIRSARRRPLLAGIIVLTLALGPSLMTIAFSIADRVVFRELPYADPTKLVALSTVLAERPDQRTPLAAAVLTRVAAEVPAFAGVGALRGASLLVAGRGIRLPLGAPHHRVSGDAMRRGGRRTSIPAIALRSD